jgi:hypothetical protein
MESAPMISPWNDLASWMAKDVLPMPVGPQMMMAFGFDRKDSIKIISFPFEPHLFDI